MIDETKTVKYIIRLPEVRKRTGLGPTRIYELEVAGKFPKRIRLSERSMGWLEHEIDAWLEERIAARDTPRRGVGTVPAADAMVKSGVAK